MNTAKKTIVIYPEEWIHVYTDGSAFKGIMNAGFGSRVEFLDQKGRNFLTHVELYAPTKKLKQRQLNQHFTVSQTSSHEWKKRRTT